ncbi:hypothetical protein EB796_021191 [Bugula neritina]|uniref:Uncharacterized protein n=1 Tax=Bugula neritina TaxID=10212 RepID=A0A7J7J4B0_BUGNE|nr:hypothetical protein EB796_021191 [Bugula neritina]
MDGQQQFLKPVQHVPFYVKRPITIDASSHPQLFAYANGGNKPASYSVDLSHPRFGRPKQTDQLSEPINRAQSKSLRDVFEKAILRGDVAIYSPDEDSGVMRNPSFITASLPRPDKHKQKSATIGGDNYMHIGKSGYRKRNDYFVDSSSDSDSDSGRGGQHNDAYIDDASSTVSDEMFKSTSEGPAHSNEEEEFQVQPLPHLLDVEVGHQAGRSTLGGFFKPKYRDYPRNNVHRSSEREHKETIDSGTSRNFRNLHRNSISLNKGDNSVHRDGSMLTHRQEPSSDSGRLPRTKLLLGERTQADLVPNIGTDWDSIAIETQGSSRQGRIERRDSGVVLTALE